MHPENRLIACCLVLFLLSAAVPAFPESSLLSFALNGRPVDLCASPSGDALYCASEGRSLYAFVDGAPSWRVELPEAPLRVVVAFDSTLLVLADAGRVTRYNRLGRPIGSFVLPAGPRMRLAAGVSGRLFLIDDTGRVGLAGPTGRLLWTVETAAGPARSVAVDDNGLLSVEFAGRRAVFNESGDFIMIQAGPDGQAGGGMPDLVKGMPPAAARLYANALVVYRHPRSARLWFATADWVLHRYDAGTELPANGPSRRAGPDLIFPDRSGSADARLFAAQLFSADQTVRQAAQAEIESRLAEARLERSLGYIGRLVVRCALSTRGPGAGPGMLDRAWAVSLLAELGEYGLIEELAAAGWRDADVTVRTELLRCFGRFGGDPGGSLAAACLGLFRSGGSGSAAFVDAFIEALGALASRREPWPDAAMQGALSEIAFGDYPAFLRTKALKTLRK